jgi:glycosyltransferase involved in cell wall biosynthesis
MCCYFQESVRSTQIGLLTENQSRCDPLHKIKKLLFPSREKEKHINGGVESLSDPGAVAGNERFAPFRHGTGRFVLDLTALLPEVTGVDRYMIQLVVHLGKVDQRNRYRIYINWEDRNRLTGLLPSNFQVIPLSLRARLARLVFQQMVMPIVAECWDADVVHSPSFIMPMVRGRRNHVLTIHDMTSFTLPRHHIPLRRSFAYRQLLLGSIRRAHVITVPSQSSREDVLHWVPDLPSSRVRVIPAGINEEFKVYPREAIRQTLERLSLPASYILYVGTIEPRKNLELLVQAYKRLVTMGKTKEHLVLAGRKGWGYDTLLKQIEHSDLRSRIHITGYVYQKDLPFLYGGASLFVYPSLQEGFGFPPLEAMACGVPTISSHTSSLGENLQGAATLISPHDLEALIEAMNLLLNDESSRNHYRKEGLVRASTFKWEETAGQTLRCYQEIALG